MSADNKDKNKFGTTTGTGTTGTDKNRQNIGGQGTTGGTGGTNTNPNARNLGQGQQGGQKSTTGGAIGGGKQTPKDRG